MHFIAVFWNTELKKEINHKITRPTYHHMIINLQKDYCKITPQTSECKSMQALVLLCYKHNTTVNVACCLGRACFGILLYLLCFSFTVSEGANSNACKNLHAKSQIYFPKTEAKRGASESREGYGHKNNNTHTRTQKVSQRETKEKKRERKPFRTVPWH